MLSIDKLYYSYNTKQVLNGVTLNAYEGSVTGLFGPNGSGKSTLFRCCLNFLKGYKGDIKLDGKDIKDLKPATMARLISYVPQEHSPSFQFTVREIVSMGRSPHMGGVFGLSADDKRKAENAMALLDISHLADTPATKLSGGQRQLALIARAVAQETKVMLLDEPTSALDFSNQILIWRILKKIALSGITIIACSHDPNHILWFCDKAVILANGDIIADGDTAEVLNSELLSKIYKNDYRIADIGTQKVICPNI